VNCFYKSLLIQNKYKECKLINITEEHLNTILLLIISCLQDDNFNIRNITCLNLSLFIKFHLIHLKGK
jgi:hypothetical protein